MTRTSATVARWEVFFEGRVQGVGFRYQTTGVAKGFEVTGTVENLPDGRVRMVAEGKTPDVEAFVAAVEDELGDYIRRSEHRKGEGPRQHTTFAIRA